MAKEMDIVERVQKTIDHVKAFGEGKDEGYGTATAVIRDATEALADARTAGVDVSGLRAELPGLERKAKRVYAAMAVDRVRKLGRESARGTLRRTPPSRMPGALLPTQKARELM